ncbi:MAG: hypothetical protein J6B44_09635 [Muribaculaceae bacterium]|nr:hypothetical protein [Muribaculaceae bacterium]
MEQLDVAIAQRDTYIEQKEKRIAELNSQLYTADNDYSRFHILDNLYGEYHPFNTDSAYNISIRQEAIAKRIGDENLLQNARMNRANILNTTGMYHECLVLMDSVKLKPLPDYLRPYYYHIMRTIYGMMADYAAFHEDKSKYFELTNLYRDSIISVNDTGSLAHVITKADFLNVSGEAEEAVKLMNSFMRDNNLSEHDKAICAWTLSEAYGRTGERELQKENLIISAISDLKSAVREYISLRQLALMLYEEGDLDRAYNFMSIAVDDAAKCNARQRIIELNDTYPMINEIYVETVRKQKETLLRYISVIVVLAFMLIILLFYMRKQMIKIKNKNKEIATAYDKQNKLTEELYKSNKKLSEANYAIAENSELKEVYIGRYMDQCLVYIEKLDGYRKSLNRLVKTGKSDELKQLLKSSSVIDDELKAFYYQFDKTFLDLFPSFVEDFNKLLLPEEAIIPKKEGTLNSELRIYALIRLGITDSEKIAKFLRYSLTTIYNYRTKVRNKAKGDRNALETEVFNIGRTIK